jgi:hypothetical protein
MFFLKIFILNLRVYRVRVVNRMYTTIDNYLYQLERGTGKEGREIEKERKKESIRHMVREHLFYPALAESKVMMTPLGGLSVDTYGTLPRRRFAHVLLSLLQPGHRSAEEPALPLARGHKPCRSSLLPWLEVSTARRRLFATANAHQLCDVAIYVH